jgi:hypothetical protein
LVDIVVELLQLIRSIVQGSDAPPSDLLSGDACQSADNGVGCFLEIIVYVIVKAFYTVTAALRSAASLLDCVICALVVAADEDAVCVDNIFAFIRPLCDLLDGIVRVLFVVVIITR